MRKIVNIMVQCYVQLIGPMQINFLISSNSWCVKYIISVCETLGLLKKPAV